MRKETVMNITEREIDDPEKEGVILEYVNFTKEFAEIKEYVRPSSPPRLPSFPMAIKSIIKPYCIAKLNAPIPPLAGIIIPIVPTAIIKNPSAKLKSEVSGRAKQTKYAAK